MGTSTHNANEFRKMHKAALICMSIAAGVICWVALRGSAVSTKLSEQMRRGPVTTIDFATIARFPWDRMYVFGPYTSAAQINASLGFQWQGVRWTSIDSSKGHNLVVFVKGNEVVHWFEHPRNRGELEDLADPNGYAREEAQFQVYRTADGRLALANIQDGSVK